MDVDLMLSSISSRKLDEWRVYYKIEDEASEAARKGQPYRVNARKRMHRDEDDTEGEE